MKLELTGHRYHLMFEAERQSGERGWGEYDIFSVTVYWWSGVGVVQCLDTADVHLFNFSMDSSRDGLGLKEALFHTQRSLSWGTSLEQLDVLDEKKIIDWMAEQILLQRNSGSVRIPDLDVEKLVELGALPDSNGQIHLAL